MLFIETPKMIATRDLSRVTWNEKIGNLKIWCNDIVKYIVNRIGFRVTNRKPHSDIARVQPTILVQDFSRLLRFVQVSNKHIRSFDAHLWEGKVCDEACCIRWPGYLIIPNVGEKHPGIWKQLLQKTVAGTLYHAYAQGGYTWTFWSTLSSMIHCWRWLGRRSDSFDMWWEQREY